LPQKGYPAIENYSRCFEGCHLLKKTTCFPL
jgi:hypothetical protein